MFPAQQTEGVRVLLDINNVSYWIDVAAISLDGKPEVRC